MIKETLLELVQANKVELVDSKEVSRLRGQTKKAEATLEDYKRRMSEKNDLVYECNCEGALPSCSYIHSVDPDRSPRKPGFCPLDGNSCCWKKVKVISKPQRD